MGNFSKIAAPVDVQAARRIVKAERPRFIGVFPLIYVAEHYLPVKVDDLEARQFARPRREFEKTINPVARNAARSVVGAYASNYRR